MEQGSESRDGEWEKIMVHEEKMRVREKMQFRRVDVVWILGVGHTFFLLFVGGTQCL